MTIFLVSITKRTIINVNNSVPQIIELTESEEKPLFRMSGKQAGWDFTIKLFQKYALNKFIARLPLT
jgi:hypothetical protein